MTAWHCTANSRVGSTIIAFVDGALFLLILMIYNCQMTDLCDDVSWSVSKSSIDARSHDNLTFKITCIGLERFSAELCYRYGPFSTTIQLNTFSNIGIVKAAVFPEPVTAEPTMSCPFMDTGIPLDWITVGLTYPSSFIAWVVDECIFFVYDNQVILNFDRWDI